MHNHLNADMNRDAHRIAYLIAGYIRQTITEAEHDELDNWVNENDHNMQLFEELTDDEHIAANLEWMDKVNSEASYNKLKESGAFDLPPKQKKFSKVWLVAATVLLLIAAFVIYKYTFSNKKQPDKENIVKIIQPGSDKATLTLEDGTIIDLTSATNGSVKSKDSISIQKIANGAIVYDPMETKVVQHKLTTPVGGQYQVVLPDGTKVWLNAASSLSYPSQFTGNDRIVGLTGEGYFEVAKDATKPFEVFSNGVQVRVLGTHFNINGYTDEPTVAATLLEGSIKILKNREVKLLTPGQQASIIGNNIAVTKTDTEQVVAWKNNEFIFRNATIESIMRQVQRWYSAEIVYQDKVDFHFNGTFDRSDPVDKILHYLEATGHVHFKTVNNKIIIMK